MTTAIAVQKATILYVDDDRQNLDSFNAVFRREYDVHLAESAVEAMAVLERVNIQVLISDQRMPGMSGSKLLEAVADRYPDMLRFMLTGFSDFDPLVRALNEGRLQGYFPKPLDVPRVKARIEKGLAELNLKKKNLELNESLQESEQTVRQQLAELEQVYATAPVGLILVDKDYRIVRINKKLAEIDGLSVEDHVGKTLDEVVPDLAPDLKKIYASVLETGEPVINTAVHGTTTQQPGIEREGLCSYYPYMNNAGHILGVIGGVIEVTELKQAEKKARKARLFTHNLLQTAHAMIISLDRDGCITIINPMVEDTTGYTSAELLGTNWFELVNPQDSDLLMRKEYARVIDGGIARTFECPIQIKDGRERIISWNVSPLKGDGAVTGTLSVGIDITRREAAEKEKDLLAEQLRHSQKMESIGTLAGGIAHDFNNILSPIIGYAEIILGDAAPGSDNHMSATEILTAGNRARDLVYQILTFSREKEQEKKPIKIQPVVKEALKLLRASLPTTIELIQRIDSNCGPIFGDPTQIYQVLMNLCTNSYQAMQAQGGRIEIVAGEVLLTDDDQLQFIGLEPGPHIRLSVSDTGPGIKPAIMERIFDPYFTTKRMESGTGLGLSVVHGIVKGHLGAIKVYSEVGQGTTFNVYLPRLVDRKSEAVTHLEASIVGGGESVLVVDDEIAIINLMQRILEKLGYRVTGFTDVRKALSSFKTNPNAYDLIISDMTMPHMNGLEFTQAVQSIRSGMLVVICTGFSEMVDSIKVETSGICGVIIKPFVKDEIARAVRKAFGDGP